MAATAVAVNGLGGGVKLAPLKLALVTPSVADTAWVSGVTPRAVVVPALTLGTTDSSTLPAGNGSAVLVRSS